jgi:hypothetical protein
MPTTTSGILSWRSEDDSARSGEIDRNFDTAKNYSLTFYEVRPRKNHRGVDLISDALPFGRLWYDGPNAASSAIGYAKFYSRSHDAVIRVYDDAGNITETHEHKGDFKEW